MANEILFKPSPVRYKKYGEDVVCNHKELKDLTQGLGDVRNYYCPDCEAHWYKGRVWTKEEWEIFVNDFPTK